MHRYVCVWYQVESLCREVASLRTTLQSKHRQFQEFMNNHERAQRFHQWWEKVRLLEKGNSIFAAPVVHREARTAKVTIARKTRVPSASCPFLIFFFLFFSFYFLIFSFSITWNYYCTRSVFPGSPSSERKCTISDGRRCRQRRQLARILVKSER